MPSVLLTHSLPHALSLKSQNSSPHLHFVEDQNNSLASALYWIDTLIKASILAREYGVCVLSYQKCPICQQLSSEEMKEILLQEKFYITHYSDVELVEYRDE